MMIDNHLQKLAAKLVRKPFPCPRPNCLKSFADEGSLKKHIALGHDMKRYVCRIDQCNREFPTRAELSRHHMQDHKGRKEQLLLQQQQKQQQLLLQQQQQQQQEQLPSEQQSAADDAIV